MQLAKKPDESTNNADSSPLLGCEELVRYAMDCLKIEGTGRLSPRDRARLASASAVLKEISEDLKAGQQDAPEGASTGTQDSAAI
ncbi:hypothetical protein LB542_27165 [Mesorhizobium sp. BR1-1-9]|uniref:hypothetical protein n=1 Tax=Mesorhizobium sp. BR1-1-9 TaxID=2876646 RepID=UPI001CD17AF8|nr:hypothetical protein [Mesorhizobium sp. BR1-1-9]MBZ9874522.1 hypothetical protein [Mesorhizobium sp. BR1-1-9]